MAVGFFFPTVFPDILEPSQEDVSILNFIKIFKLYKKKSGQNENGQKKKMVIIRTWVCTITSADVITITSAD